MHFSRTPRRRLSSKAFKGKHMFTYASSDTIIPSLTFTKAELVYAITVLMPDIPLNDNQTKLELVELRYFLNKIKDRVAIAASDGSLERAMVLSNEEMHKDILPKTKAAPMPSMSELQAKFPTLTAEEIQETIEKANEDSRKEEELREIPSPLPPKPSFISKPKEENEESTPPKKPMTKEEERKRENSRKFAKMLGQF